MTGWFLLNQSALPWQQHINSRVKLTCVSTVKFQLTFSIRVNNLTLDELCFTVIRANIENGRAASL